MAEPGFAVEFNIDPQGSELDVAATATDTVLYLGDASDYDAPGTVRVDNGTVQVDIDIVDVDVDAATITLGLALGVVADVGDRVYILSADEIAVDHTLTVHTSDGDSVEIAVDYADRILWAEGPIDPPVPVLVSDDLTEIVDVPGRRALVNPSSFVAPLFIGYLGTNQSIPTGATFTTVTSWVTRTLAGDMVYDAPTSSVVVPLDGWYSVIHSAVAWTFDPAGRRAIQPVYLTAAGAVPGGVDRIASSDPVTLTTPVVSPLQPLAAGEAVTLAVSQNSGASLALIGSSAGVESFFCVEYRGPL